MQGERLRQRGGWVALGQNYPYTFPAACSTEGFPTLGSDAVPACPMPCAPSAAGALESEIMQAYSLCMWWVTASPANITGTRLLLSSHWILFSSQPCFLYKWYVILLQANVPGCTIFGKLYGQFLTRRKTYHETYCFRLAWSNEQNERGGRRQKIMNSLLLLPIPMIRVSHFWTGQKYRLDCIRDTKQAFPWVWNQQMVVPGF